MSQSPTSRRKQRVLRSATMHITSDGLLQFLDIALDALLVIDQAGTIMMVNEQTEALFGTVLTEPTTGYVLGADDYVIKPFQPEALVSTLDHLVTFRQSSSQASKRETRL